MCDTRSCTNLVNHLHCKICSGNVSFQHSYYILRYIKQIHLNQNHYVIHDSVVCLPYRCGILPLTSKSRKAKHYHCAKCIAIVKQKGHVLQHLKSHLIEKSESLKKNSFQVLPNKSNLQKKKKCFHILLKHFKSQILLKQKFTSNRSISYVALRVQWCSAVLI